MPPVPSFCQLLHSASYSILPVTPCQLLHAASYSMLSGLTMWPVLVVSSMLELEQYEGLAAGADVAAGPGILPLSPVLSGNVTTVSIKSQMTRNWGIISRRTFWNNWEYVYMPSVMFSPPVSVEVQQDHSGLWGGQADTSPPQCRASHPGITLDV